MTFPLGETTIGGGTMDAPPLGWTAEGRARVDARLDAGPPRRADEFSPIARMGSPGIARRDVTAPRRRAGNPRAAGLVVSVIDAIAAAAIVAGSTANPG